jgi:holo-[acyl-carrier protein] synthase
MLAISALWSTPNQSTQKAEPSNLTMAILGVGVDIVECLRIAQMIERHGELFITRVYTDSEIEYCTTRKAATQHYAGRWAAKEAVLKALGTGWRRGIGWRDIEIRNDKNGAPTVKLRGGARDVMEKAGIQTLHVSISHSRSFAVAHVVAEGERSGA